MLFMIIWWILIVIIIILFLIKLISKNKNTKRIFDNAINLFAILQIIIIVVAVATKDPIFQDIGLPQGYEWIGGLLSGGFILWISYLNPLKNRVIVTETRVANIQGKVNEIKEDVSWIKNNCEVSFKK